MAVGSAAGAGVGASACSPPQAAARARREAEVAARRCMGRRESNRTRRESTRAALTRLAAMPFGPLLGRKLISAEDDRAIVEEIRRAEQGSRGEVRVHLERRCKAAEPMDRAKEIFGQLGMHETNGATGVLLY